jgi:hypothetical protein
MQDSPDVESNIAVCYLFADGDPKNRCVLTTRNLVITYRFKDHIFPLETLTGFGIERKRLLLPVVAGGIFIPLSVIGSVEFSVSPVVTFVLIMAGVFIFYIGWSGTEVLALVAPNQSFHCPFKTESTGIREFVVYVNSMIERKNTGALLYYAVIPGNVPGKDGIVDYIVSNPSGVRVFSYSGLMSLSGSKYFSGSEFIYSFNPLSSGISVKYVQTEITVAWPGSLQAGDLKFLGNIKDFYQKETGTELL